MRKFLLAAMAVVMVMGISRTDSAEPLTTNRLLEICETEAAEMMCGGYMAGFFQGVTAANRGASLADRKVCWPKGFNARQLLKMFVKSANEAPELLHLPASNFLFLRTAKPFTQSTDAGICPD